MTPNSTPGAVYLGDGCTAFRVRAPLTGRVDVHLFGDSERYVPLEPAGDGYFRGEIEGVEPGARYKYRLGGVDEWPDPASRFQPEGIHGPSAVLGAEFGWTDDCWRGLPLQEYIIYELHVGTFSREGTFDGAIARLPYLVSLGVTAVEVMPIAQFPGTRNWGYDGVFPFAAQDSYGGAEGFKRFVDACHATGLAVILDVVNNHLGAEGNYLWKYGHYFTDRYHTPWGSALNFDGPHSDEVRAYFHANALYWLQEFHVDALRLDAVDAILDFTAGTFLGELAGAVEQEGLRQRRLLFLIAESDLNDPRLCRTVEQGGYGLDAQWSDDFHHSLHTLLTGESDGYYADFNGKGHAPLRHLAKALREGFVYSGQHAVSRGRRHGLPSIDLPAYRFVICSQNHDQVGNRMLGERLSALVPFDRLKLAAGTLLLSPYLPLLFMGEEYGEPAPFQYFISHTDPALAAAVRQGRAQEFAAFDRKSDPPDPQSEETFRRSTPDLDLHCQGKHAALFDLYRRLIELRKTVPALRALDKEKLEVKVYERENALTMRRWEGESDVLCLFNYGEAPASLSVYVQSGRWHKLLDSAERHEGLMEGREAAVLLPAMVETEGCADMTVPAESFAVYARGG